ncbi:hypothetical protein E2C01_079414 [Portunus trituberculatus]|uniref:Uncharacterized protein n=1 Tax=Portunus trituberculatus TaxID=210409 RepID=A0A5B7IRC8_PORTR|nr:hypothetical protein [Portunus trituberculatus]
MTTVIKSNPDKYSILTANYALHRGKQSSQSGNYLIERRSAKAFFVINSFLGSQMCSFSLNKSKIFFSTSTPHFQTFLHVTT